MYILLLRQIKVLFDVLCAKNVKADLQKMLNFMDKIGLSYPLIIKLFQERFARI